MARIQAIIGPALRDVHRQYAEVVAEAISVNRSHIALEKISALCRRYRAHIDECLEIIERMP